MKYTQKPAEKSGAMLLDELREQEDIMRDNQIIAEFMGDGKEYEVDINTKTLKSYNTSWDWLMPVAEKCLTTDENTDGQHYFINDSLLTCNIEEVYDRVVGFINEYNKIK